MGDVGHRLGPDAAIGLGDAVATAQRLLAGQVRGRVVVDVNR